MKREEAIAQLSALIKKIMAGEEVIIGKAGKPVYNMFFLVLARRYDAAAKYSITLP